MTVTLKRCRDWESRLADAIEARRDTPPDWGVHDCCMAAAYLIQAETSVDIVPRTLRGYKTERGARFRLSKYGGVAGLAEFCLSPFGIEKWPFPKMAQRGDMAILELDDNSHALGVVDLSGKWILAPALAAGWERRPLGHGLRAWKIG